MAYHVIYTNNGVSGLGLDELYDYVAAESFSSITQGDEYQNSLVNNSSFLSGISSKLQTTAYNIPALRQAIKNACKFIADKATSAYEKEPNGASSFTILEGELSVANTTVIHDVVDAWERRKEIISLHIDIVSQIVVDEYNKINPPVDNTSGNSSNSGSTSGGSSNTGSGATNPSSSGTNSDPTGTTPTPVPTPAPSSSTPKAKTNVNTLYYAVGLAMLTAGVGTFFYTKTKPKTRAKSKKK